MAGYVHHFADEKQTWNSAALHGLGGKFAGIDSSRGDFSLFVTFGARGMDFPTMSATVQFGESSIVECRRRIELQPAIGQAIGQKLAEGGVQSFEVAGSRALSKAGSQLPSRSQIDEHG